MMGSTNVVHHISEYSARDTTGILIVCALLPFSTHLWRNDDGREGGHGRAAGYQWYI